VVKGLEIDEVSAVSAGANPLAKVVLLKRDADRELKTKIDHAVACLAKSIQSIVNDPSANTDEMLARSFSQFMQHIGRLTKTRIPLEAVLALHKLFKNTDERAEPDLSRSDEGYGGRTRRQYYEDEDRRDENDEDNEKDKTDMTEKSLNDIVKRFGFVALAKSINAGSVTLTEEEYTKPLVDDCARRGVSFEKVFCDNTSEGLEIRKGRERCRDEAFLKGTLMPIAPTFVGGAAARDVDAGEEGDAYQALVAMAERMRAASPGMKLDEAFSRTYQDPANAEKARRERIQSRNRLPVTGGFGSGTLAPLQVDKAERDVSADEDGGEHYEKLMVLAEQAHAAQPEQSVAQHFAKIFSSREHRDLAEAERKANRPRA
jgi:hypothetical protein